MSNFGGPQTGILAQTLLKKRQLDQQDTKMLIDAAKGVAGTIGDFEDRELKKREVKIREGEEKRKQDIYKREEAAFEKIGDISVQFDKDGDGFEDTVKTDARTAFTMMKTLNAVKGTELEYKRMTQLDNLATEMKAIRGIVEQRGTPGSAPLETEISSDVSDTLEDDSDLIKKREVPANPGVMPLL